VDDLFPSPKSHTHWSWSPVDASLNLTVSGAGPDSGVPEKSGMSGSGINGVKGTEDTVMYSDRTLVLLPSAFVAFSETVKLPFLV